MAECDVGVGVAGDVELFGALELFGIAICRADDGENELPRQERLAIQLNLADGCAKDPLKRRAVTKHFFHGRGKQVHVGPKERQLRRIVHETEHRVVDEIGGGLLSADDEQLEKTKYL